MPPLLLPLRSSCSLVLLLAFMHILALFSVCISAAPWLLQFLVSMGIVASLFWVLDRYAFRFAWQHLHIQASGDWLLARRNGEIVSAQLKGSSVVTRYITILNFGYVNSKRRFSLVLLPPNLGQENFRKLCIYLRCMRPNF